MDINKTLIALATVVSVCIAQNTNISGTVTDSGGTAIEGADVRLEKGELATTTGGDGSFTLSGTTGIIDQITEATLHNILSATINNGLLYIHVQEKSAIKIVTYNLQGKALSAIQKTIDAGTNSIAMPLTEAGVYLHKIKAGSSEAILKSYSIGGTSGGRSASVLGSSSSAGQPQATGHFPIHDVIAVTKNGYLNYRVVVTNSDTANIEIKMIASAGTVTDADGNVYQTVKIGNQVWTVENLRTTKYNDGTPIPQPDSAAWNMSTTPGYCFYNNTTNADSIKKYGAFYNWYTVDTKKLAPEGWHVPDTTDWNTLENYLIANGYNWDGTTTGNKIAKSMATKADWRDYDTPGTIGYDLRKNNRSGFSALPCGSRLFTGYFFAVGNNGNWWSATESGTSDTWYRLLCYDYYYLYIFYSSKSCGFSVRLVKD